MSTYDKLLALTNTLIQQKGFEGFSYADLAATLGIRKASIHYHFPGKSDLGEAYCRWKADEFLALEQHLSSLPSAKERLNGYLEAFRQCATEGQMCGVYALLSDFNMLSPALQQAVNQVAQLELRILSDILSAGLKTGNFHFSPAPEVMAMILCHSLKGSLLLNPIAPHQAYNQTITALQQLVCPIPSRPS